MLGNAVAFVAQHVQKHVAGEKHVCEFVDGLQLQRLRLLEERLFEERHTFDGLREGISEFGFFVSHLSRSDFFRQNPTHDFATSRDNVLWLTNVRPNEKERFMKRFPLLALAFIFAASSSTPPAVERAMKMFSKDAMRAHDQFLSSDLLEGRGPGTRGDDLAMQYIAAQFESYGLEPAGDNGTYYQHVPL